MNINKANIRTCRAFRYICVPLCLSCSCAPVGQPRWWKDPTGYFHLLLTDSSTVVGPMQRELEVMQPQMAASSNSQRIERRDWRATAVEQFDLYAETRLVFDVLSLLVAHYLKLKFPLNMQWQRSSLSYEYETYLYLPIYLYASILHFTASVHLRWPTSQSIGFSLLSTDNHGHQTSNEVPTIKYVAYRIIQIIVCYSSSSANHIKLHLFHIYCMKKKEKNRAMKKKNLDFCVSINESELPPQLNRYCIDHFHRP